MERISGELDSIRACLAALESTLARPLTDTTWHRCPRRQLRALVDCFEQHRSAAEGADGVFGEIEVAQGHGRELTTGRRLHRSAMRQAEELFDALGTKAGGLTPDDARTRGRRLASAIRRHEALHGDFVLHVFDRDTGVGD
jgi:hypothetical protein